jgi:hypothetical protein
MRRRDFVILLGGGILVWTQRVSAQQPGELPIIGYMGQHAASGCRYRPLLSANFLIEHSFNRASLDGRTQRPCSGYRAEFVGEG